MASVLVVASVLLDEIQWLRNSLSVTQRLELFLSHCKVYRMLLVGCIHSEKFPEKNAPATDSGSVIILRQMLFGHDLLQQAIVATR